MKFGAIIITTNFSLKKGVYKPLQKIQDKTLLAHCICTMQQSGIQKIIVINNEHDNTAIQRETKRLRVENFFSAISKKDIFSVLRQSIKSMQGVDGFFIFPCNVPLVRTITIQQLCTSFQKQPRVLYPEFNGISGHPVLVPFFIGKKPLYSKENLNSIIELQYDKSKRIAVWDSYILSKSGSKHLEKLGHKIKRYDILTAKEAEILASFYMTSKGITHGRLVASIAFSLAKGIEKNRKNRNSPKKKFDYELLYGAALLHDMCKGISHHERAGEQLLHSFGLHKMAMIVGAHRSISLPKNGILQEKELVCLADKLASGKHRVDLHKKFTEKLHIYRHNSKECHYIRQRMKQAESLRLLWEKNSGMKIEKWLKNEGLGK